MKYQDGSTDRVALVLELPVPPSANRWWRMGRTGQGRGARHMHKSAAASSYQADVFRRACLARGLPPFNARLHPAMPQLREYLMVHHRGDWPMFPKGTPCRVTITWYRNPFTGDMDKRVGILLDALQGIAYDKDSQVAELHAYRLDVREESRVRVEVEAIANAQETAGT